MQEQNTSITMDEIDTLTTPEHDRRRRLMGLYLCLVCRKGFARWPTERAFRRVVLGVEVTLVFRAPFACSECRLFRQSRVRAMGVTRSRRFWNRVLDWLS